MSAARACKSAALAAYTRVECTNVDVTAAEIEAHRVRVNRELWRLALYSRRTARRDDHRALLRGWPIQSRFVIVGGRA